MAIKRFTPDGMAAPAANYNHVVDVPGGTRLVFLSGQLGVRRDGTIPEDFEGQVVVTFENIVAGLAGAGLTMADVVKLTAYVTDRSNLAPYMAVRDRFVARPAPASTLLIVSGFARPEFLVEIEAIAGTSG